MLPRNGEKRKSEIRTADDAIASKIYSSLQSSIAVVDKLNRTCDLAVNLHFQPLHAILFRPWPIYASNWMPN